MKELRFTFKDPEKAYITNNMLLPKKRLHVDRIKAALTFIHGEEEEVDENGVLICTTQGTFEMWDETKHHLVVPREFLTEDQRGQFDFEFVDERPSYRFDSAEIYSRVKARDEGQERALSSLMDNKSGTLTLSCGKGKTVMALAHAAALKVPTIVVVNTTALLEQWLEEINTHLDVSSVGIVQGTVADWKGHPIVVAMVHTLSARRAEWSMEFRRRFGLVIYDEGHHMSAPVFVLSADLFFGRRYSLTATPERTDGLESIYQYHLGRVIHKNLEQDLIPTTWFHVLHWALEEKDKKDIVDIYGTVNLNKVRTFLGQLAWRNEIIEEDLRFDLAAGRKILVLSHSVEHVENLCARFSPMGAGAITGATAQEDRMGILRECNPVFGTFQLAREGLNKPVLDTLYLVTPFSNKNDLQQTLGRIQREYADKKDPLVRVYEDKAINCCVTSCRKLRKILLKWGHPARRRKVDVLAEV
jgi:superfamily II DNA or RNA helicase